MQACTCRGMARAARSDSLLAAAVLLAAVSGLAPHRARAGEGPAADIPVRLEKRVRSARDRSTQVLVPAGWFWRGSDDREGQADERPKRRIFLEAFYIDRLEVSNARYMQCVRAGACRPPEWAKEGSKYNVKTGFNHTYRGFSGPQQPISGVSWQDARSYCRWAGRRLPTEAEWEKAARGGDGRLYPWGNSRPTCALAAFDRGDGRYCTRHTAPVAGYARAVSPCGALQMAGNVWEWVADWHSDTYYRNCPEKNPPGPTSGITRVLRGGSWYTLPDGLRTTCRASNPPAFRSREIGFRCARDAR